MRVWRKLSLVLQAALIAFAVQGQYGVALNRADYEEEIDYLYAKITGLLGEYNFNGLLIFLLALVFVCWMRQSGYVQQYKKGLLPYLFSFFLLIGQSYAQEGSWSGCFGGVFRMAGFLLAFAGYSILFRYLIALFLGLYQKAVYARWCPARIDSFLGEKCFRNVFLLLLALWMPVMILSYPGNLCYDFMRQMGQVFGLSDYSTHHPLLHTFLAGGIIRFGGLVTGSLDIGLFLYILLQAVALAAALAGTVSRLARRGVSCLLRVLVVCVYVLAPMYSNMVSTAIKDVPFMAAVIWYILLLEDMVAEGFEGRKPMDWGKLVLAQVLVGLLRNNGIYVVVLTGIFLIGRYRKKVLLLCTMVMPLVICLAANAAMAFGVSAEKGSSGEMLSIPFQQTARYIQSYGDELTVEEREIIAEVLTDADLVAEKYDPDISDPVKALYLEDAGASELAAYFKVWAAGFFRHPAVYCEAFFAHVYGWFDPGVSNAIRYKMQTDLFSQGGVFPGADKMLQFVYRVAEHIPFLAVLQNVGIYVWLLFILGEVAIREKRERGVLLVPLFISLLICMAAPCYYLHPRYAFPIMFTIPFLYGIMKGGAYVEKNTGDEQS